MNYAVAAVIEDGKENILLVRRGKDARSEVGKWENCGGGVEEGESKEEALIREVFEELGCKVKVKHVLYTDKGDEWEVDVFSTELLGEPSIQDPNEISEFKWVLKSELGNEDLTTYTRRDFERFGWISAKI